MFLKKLFTPQSISVVFTLQTIKVREEEKQEMGDTMRERERERERDRHTLTLLQRTYSAESGK